MILGLKVEVDVLPFVHLAVVVYMAKDLFFYHLNNRKIIIINE